MKNLPTAPLYELKAYRTPEEGWKLQILAHTTAILEPIKGTTSRRIRHPERPALNASLHERDCIPYVRHRGSLDEFEVVARCEPDEILEVKERLIALFEKHVRQTLDGLNRPMPAFEQDTVKDEGGLYHITLLNSIRLKAWTTRIDTLRVQQKTDKNIFYRSKSEETCILPRAFLGLPPTWAHGDGVSLTAWTDEAEAVESIKDALVREYEAYKERVVDGLEQALQDVERLKTEEPIVRTTESSSI